MLVEIDEVSPITPNTGRKINIWENGHRLFSRGLGDRFEEVHAAARKSPYFLPTLWSQGGDMLESFSETLNISWFPEKPENSDASVVVMWSACGCASLCDSQATSVVN